MKRLVHRALFVVALLAGTVVTSCAAYTPPVVDSTANVIEVRALLWIHIINNQDLSITVTAVWAGGREVLGKVFAGGNQVFSLDVGNGIELRMEVKMSDGYRCVTYGVFAWPGQMLTLRLLDGYPEESFCTPIGLGPRQDRRA
ncbi:MAG: hypothetical protein QQN63_13765 [Nitrosopumilus sp.]